ncbi:YidH family protein [Loktanella agnita]|uniref:YidH family protein n=1 Tax=Loktanella agnita TaxID=287097 RepID=UPI0039864DC2
MTDNNELAETRTDWAEDRTILANERTFAGWMRTGMACVAIAIGLKAVFGDFDPTWGAKAVATIFLVAAIGIFWSARQRACATLSRLNQRDAEAQTSNNFTIMVITLTTATIAVGGILWWL